MKDSIRQIKPGAFQQSVAGEEDPGASLDVPAAPAPRRGDEVPSGTPGSGEVQCPVCGGSGRGTGGTACAECNGTGKVNRGIGGG
jgi:hypothetical protein